MPRTLPAGLVDQWKKSGAGLLPIVLVDIELRDGTRHYWADTPGTYTKIIGSGSVAYKPWLKRGLTIRRSMSLRTDAGSPRVQNVSGNTIERDVSKLFRDQEFEGAMVVIRLLNPPSLLLEEEFHGFLGEPDVGKQEVTLRCRQLLDTSGQDIPLETVGERCPWAPARYKGKECGSTGSASTCDGTFDQCKDATRAAQERFSGVPASVPANQFTPSGGGAAEPGPNDPGSRDRGAPGGYQF